MWKEQDRKKTNAKNKDMLKLYRLHADTQAEITLSGINR